MERLKIWLIQIAEPLPNQKGARKMRTSLLSDELKKRGHTVTWWTSAFDHFDKKWIFREDTDLELGERFTVKALKGIGYKNNFSLFRFIDHRIIASKFEKKACKMERPDIIIASLPSYDMAYRAVRFAKENNVPVLVDIRDEWPDLFLDYVPRKFKRLARIALHGEFKMLTQTVRQADGLIAMMESLLGWGLNYAGRERGWKDGVFYLGYKREVDAADSTRLLKMLNGAKERFVVAFIGTFVDNNDPSVIIECAQKLKDEGILFVLAGSGELFEKIKMRSSPLSNVLMTGWLNGAEIAALLGHSHIGVCPTPKDRPALPNKAFAYLSGGLPVVSAFQGDLKEIIEKRRVGLNFAPNDVESLSNCIMRLHNDTALYKEMSGNALRLYSEAFDADRIYVEYADHIEKVAGSHEK
jgi:glycosyltransferase involved in cell wall biosynthesis